jgi:hypothetical protein
VDKQALKDLLYGGIEEMTQNSRLYYHSSIGTSYSHWTEAGAKNLAEFLNLMAGEMARCRVDADMQRSKDMVMKELKS